MRSIFPLSEEVINQIAAGEVVEHPASVVKELIENAIDAKARHIEIAIEQGGFELIRVEDDGMGMHSEDALWALQRHATSKLRTTQDLESLLTMGFRGEALAAIASISHTTLLTAAHEGTASRICTRGHEKPHCEPATRNQGTTVEVSSLFYNVPARRQFQKSPPASSSEIVRTVKILALAHPHIAFRLVSEERVLLQVESQEPSQRWESLLSSAFLQQGFSLSFTQEPFHVYGYLASPQQAKCNRMNQYFFLNRRALFSPLISRAIKEAYATRLPEKLHPSFILHLEAPPHLFDINVHPQKREVRFQREKELFSLLLKAAHQALLPPSFSHVEPLSWSAAPGSEQICALQEMAFLPPAEPALFQTRPRPIALLDAYLLLQDEGAWLLVDIRALHLHVLLGTLNTPASSSEAETLITPLELFLSREEGLLIEEWIAEWASLGILARRIGKEAVAIDALPPWLSEAEWIPFLALWREEGGSPQRAQKTLQRLYRGTQKRYSCQEGSALLERVLKNEAGMDAIAPFSLRLTRTELATLFERR